MSEADDDASTPDPGSALRRVRFFVPTAPTGFTAFGAISHLMAVDHEAKHGPWIGGHDAFVFLISGAIEVALVSGGIAARPTIVTERVAMPGRVAWPVRAVGIRTDTGGMVRLPPDMWRIPVNLSGRLVTATIAALHSRVIPVLGEGFSVLPLLTNEDLARIFEMKSLPPPPPQYVLDTILGIGQLVDQLAGRPSSAALQVSSTQEQRPGSRGGRPPTIDWAAFNGAIATYAALHEVLPEKTHRPALAKHMTAWVTERYPGRDIDGSTIRKAITSYYAGIGDREPG